ncbi:MAG: dihydrolipoamide acetyltransferase family protein, partial [Anaerolineae bacterium]
WVPGGAPIAVIGSEGEEGDLAALGVDGAQADEATQEEPEPAQAAEPVKEPEKVSHGENGAGLPDGVRASPLARRVADELGVDISRVSGSGPKGRIVRADVESFAEAAGEETHRDAAPAAPSPEAPAQSIRPVSPQQIQGVTINIGPDDNEIETSRLRRRIAERMTTSKAVALHFYVTTEIDMGPALALRKDLNARLEEQGVKISVNDIIVKAVALALRDYPNLNAAYNGDTVVRYGHINVGIAVAVENGLLNVVAKDADLATLGELARKNKEMITRARDGKVHPQDIDGETFAVSNLGAYDVDHFIAIINQPNAGILAVGSAKQVPVVVDGEITIGWRMKATVSADHRVTDGAEAAEFVRRVKELLEDPMSLLI